MTGIDYSELNKLAVSIGRVGQDTAPAVRQVLRDHAIAIQDQMRKDLRGSKSFAQAATDVTTSFTETNTLLESETGPEVRRGKKHAGPLAHIAYFGTATQPGGGNVRSPFDILDEQGPRFAAELEDLARSRLLEGL